MTTPDLLYLAFIAIALLLDHFVLWSRFRRRSQTDPAPARLWLWRSWMGMLWMLVVAGILLWVLDARAWGSLGLIVPHGWRLIGALVLVVLLAAVYWRTVARLARTAPSKLTKSREKFGAVADVVPHTGPELLWFVALSLTAGFSEEFIFRGYLIWVFQPALGWWGAAALSVVLFGAAHAYQGTRGAVASGIIGALFTLALLIFRSLLPAIVLHAMLDVGQGLVAWMVFREGPGARNPTDGLADRGGASATPGAGI